MRLLELNYKHTITYLHRLRSIYVHIHIVFLMTEALAAARRSAERLRRVRRAPWRDVTVSRLSDIAPEIMNIPRFI